jgi:NRPS condensation-like uncharacterized protein
MNFTWCQKITQLQKIEYKKYERKLVPFERRFFRGSTDTISIVARVKGFISEEDIRNALYKVRQQHPLVGVRVYLDENNDAWYTTEKVPENPLKVVQHASEKDWYRELLNEYKIRFETEKGPLARFVLVQSPEISEIIIICHHVICDGTALAILARDLLLYVGNPDRKVQEMSEPPLATPENFPIDIKIGKLMMFVINKMNKMGQKYKVIFDEEDEDNIFRAFWDKYDFKVISVELNEKETSDLAEKCNQHGITVNSALNTAFLAARYSIRGHFKGGRRNIMIPVNTRERYKKPVGEHFGLYFSVFQFKLSYNPKKDFWENAKIFNEKVREKLDIKKVFKIAALIGLFDQSLVDTRSFSFMGNLVPSNFSRYEKIHAFSNDEKNMINKRTKKQIPKMPGLAITNLGRLDYPTKYGPLELERFIFITSGTPYMELVIPVVTVAEKLTFTINYLEGTTDTPTMEKIKNKALKYLGLAKY